MNELAPTVEPVALQAIDKEGYALFEGVFSPAEVTQFLASIAAALENGGEAVLSRSGVPYAARNLLDFCPEIARQWTNPLLVDLIETVLGKRAGLVRALYLDKPPGESWAVPWHKDVIVPVKPGQTPSTLFSQPTDRAGVPHAEAPLNVLRKMLTLRIHLDESVPGNGPLRILPGSHATGKTLVIDGYKATPVYAQAGDVLALRPLVAHKSGHAAEGTDIHRRVLQLHFASDASLPDGYEWVNFIPVS